MDPCFRFILIYVIALFSSLNSFSREHAEGSIDCHAALSVLGAQAGARSLAKEGRREGATGNARGNDFTERYKNGELEEIEKPAKTTKKNGEGGLSDLEVVAKIARMERLTEAQRHELGERIHQFKRDPQSEDFKDHKGDLDKAAIRELARAVRENRDFDPAQVKTKSQRQQEKKQKKEQKKRKRNPESESKPEEELGAPPQEGGTVFTETAKPTEQAPPSVAGQTPKLTGRLREEGFLDFYDDLVVYRGPQMDKALTLAAENVPKADGWLTIVVHGSEFEPRINPPGRSARDRSSSWSPISAGNLAEAIRDLGVPVGIDLRKYKGIILVSCYGGSCQNGFAQAQAMANSARLPVISADGTIRSQTLAVEDPQNGATDNPWRVFHPRRGRGYTNRDARNRGNARFVLQELNRRHQINTPHSPGQRVQGARESVGTTKFEDFYHIVDQARRSTTRPRRQKERSSRDVHTIGVGDVVSIRLRGTNEIITGRYSRGMGASESQHVLELSSENGGPGRRIFEQDILSLRKGKSVEILHDFTPADLVEITSLRGNSLRGKITGYSSDGIEIFFLPEGSNKVIRLATKDLKSAKLIEPGFSLSETEMRALPDSSQPGSMAEDPNNPIPIEEKRRLRKNAGITDFRPHEFPYATPPEAIEGNSASPIRLDQITLGIKYLWIIKSDGTMIIAPEEPASRRGQERYYIKHRDLDPTPNGLQGSRARIGGEFKLIKREDGSFVVTFNRDSSYSFNRIDDVDLQPNRHAYRDWLDRTIPEIFGRNFQNQGGATFQEVGPIE